MIDDENEAKMKKSIKSEYIFWNTETTSINRID